MPRTSCREIGDESRLFCNPFKCYYTKKKKLEWKELSKEKFVDTTIFTLETVADKKGQ